MTIKYTETNRGLTPFEWSDIPPFAILTGLNGAGKSQFLDLVRSSFMVNHLGSFQVIHGLVTSGFSCSPAEVSYISGEWQLNNTRPINLQTLQSIGEELYRRVGQNMNQNPRYLALVNNLKDPKGRGFHELTAEEFSALLPPDFFEHESSMPEQITKIFINYQTKHITATHYKEEEKFLSEYGEAPWKIMDTIFKESNLPFTFNNPEEEKFDMLKPFQFKLFDLKKNEVPFSDLSSGEKVLVSLVLFLYNSNSRGIFPKLLLMDEPDAHLHPSMTHQFLRVIKNVLVDTHGVRVIMTTHSPSTIALAPEDSIFIMDKPTRIFRPSSKNQAISLLTAGLVFVAQGTKTIIVEDESDVVFYNEFYNQLLEVQSISASIPIVFIPASSKMAEKSGGKTVVNDWAGKFFDAGHGAIIQGLIDLDSGNASSKGVHLLTRYSIENYLVDPLVVYSALLGKPNLPIVEGISLGIGDEYKIRALSAADLQRIANKIHSEIKSSLITSLPGYREEDNELYEETYLSGQKLMYPKYLVTKRGKDLKGVYQNVFKLNHNDLIIAFRRLKMIPIDIRDLIKHIQET